MPRPGRLYPEFDSLPEPRNWPEGGYLYAIGFGCGLVKVGSTRNPRERTLQLQRIVKQAAQRIAFVQLADGSNMHTIERAAVARAAAICPPCAGREYYRDVSFDQAERAITNAAQEALLLAALKPEAAWGITPLPATPVSPAAAIKASKPKTTNQTETA